jgi:quercetin dioxygenase-like cupin family protein
MNRRVTIILSTIALLSTVSATAAQNAPPTYQADPSVYKVIFEDPNFRVIAATWKAGQTDKPHSHPVASIIYNVNDCTLKLTAADGKTTNITPKAGTSNAVPITASHTAENTGSADCRAIFVERK